MRAGVGSGDVVGEMRGAIRQQAVAGADGGCTTVLTVEGRLAQVRAEAPSQPAG